MSIRGALSEKPWIGWAVAGALGILGAILVLRGLRGGDTTRELAQDVTIVYEDTGAQEIINRGRFEALLIEISARGELAVEEGLTNPKTGKKTGFPTDRAYWDRIVPAILEARRERQTGGARDRSGGRTK